MAPQDNNQKDSALSEDAKAKLAAAMGASTPDSTVSTNDTSATGDSSDVYTGVVGIIDSATGLQPDELTRDADLRNDLHIDSLSMLDIAVRIENTFGVRVSEDDVQSTGTVGQLVDMVEKLHDN